MQLRKLVTFSHYRIWRLQSVSLVLLMCVVTVSLVWPIAPTAASWWDGPKDVAIGIISWVLYWLVIRTMGIMATVATDVLVYTAQLNNFTDLPVIIEAWSTVRDFANMFFVVVLLVIAFGTLFGIESYSWKKLLPKMVLAAILINYSRAICGFIVDASQVVMLTFVAAIKDAASVGITQAFSLDKLLQFGTQTVENGIGDKASTTSGERLLGIVAAGFMLSTLFSVQCVYIVILIGRLVMIWFLTVLSPLAYISKVLPQTEKFSSQWWELFLRYVTVGPLMMFFLWLAMFIAARSADNGGLGTVAAGAGLVSLEANKVKATGTGTAAALDTSLLAGFIIASGMMAIGAKLANESARELSQYTGKAESFGKWITRKPYIKAASYLNDKQAMKTGYDFNLPRVYKTWQHGLETNKRRRENQIAATAGEKYRQGNLMAGVLGAGDQVAETGLTLDQLRGGVIGNIPLVGTWLSSRGIGLNKESRFRRALEAEEKAEENQYVTEDALAKLRDVKGNGLKTNAEYDSEQLDLNKFSDAAAIIHGDYHTNPTNMEFDMTNASHKSLVEARISKLQSSLSDSTVSVADKQANAREMANLQKGLAMKKFKQADVGVNMMAAVNENFTEAHTKATDHALQANRDAATNSGAFHTRADIEAHLDGDVDIVAAKADFDNAEAIAKDTAHKRHALGPQMGSGWEIKFRTAVNEEASKIKTTDADALRDGFMEALETNKSIEMAAYYEKLCETGNDNEAYKALGLKFNAGEHGARELARRMQQAGLSKQAALSTMNRGAQLSEAVGHTPVTQLCDVKGGEIRFRSKHKQIAYAKCEEAKKNQKNHQLTATRLSVGELSEKMDLEDAEYEEEFVERRVLNILGTEQTDKTSKTNIDFLKGTMRNKERWKLYQKVIHEKLRKEGPEAIKRLKDECAKNGILIAE